MNDGFVPFCVIRLVILVGGAVVIPTLIRKRVGGKTASYAALMLGLVALILGEACRLVAAESTGWLVGLGSLTNQLPIHIGGFLLLAVGFFSLLRDVRAAQAQDRLSATHERARADEARFHEAKLRAVLNGATDYCIITCAPDGRITSYSDGGARTLGWSSDEAVGKMRIQQLLSGKQDLKPEALFDQVNREGHVEAELVMVRKGGDEIPVLLTVTPLTDPEGRTDGYIGIAKDITDLKAAHDALRRERDFVQGIIETNELFIVGCSLADGRVTMFNHGAERITGYRRDEVIGREYIDVFLTEQDRPALRQAFKEARAGAFTLVGERENVVLTKRGEGRLMAVTYTVSTDAAGQPCHVVVFGNDVTEQRRMQASLEKAKADLEQANAALERMATTDYLTGLINRRQASLLFDREIARSRRNCAPVGIVLMDLDHFKAINDTYGHEVGDACLKHVAEQLRGRLRASDIISRYGGEEFLIILPETGLDQAALLADVVRRRIQETVVVHGTVRIHLSASFGVTALELGQDVSDDTLVRRADEAMYCAKNLGGNRVIIWNRMQEGKVAPSLATSEQVLELQKRIEALTRRNREAFIENMYRLVESIEARNPYTANQSRHVAEYAVSIAQEMGFAKAAIQSVHRAAMLHDLGMAAIPDKVLWKDEPLSRSDWELVCQHPAATCKIIEKVQFLHRESFVIRHHHERPDGRGYPDGLTGDAVPVEARILAVADALEAMTRDRPHRPAFTLQETLEQLRSGAPKQFDPDVVAAVSTAARKTGDWPKAAHQETPAAAPSTN